MHAALVGEGAGADERLAGTEVHVGRLVHVARHLGQPAQAAGLEHVVAALESEVGDHAHEVHVAAALADAVHCPLHLGCPLRHGGQGVGHRHVAVVVTVDAQLGPDGLAGLLDGRGDVVGQGAAVRVAQDQDRRAGLLGGSQGSQGVVTIVAEAVEKMLRIVKDLSAGLLAVSHRVADHAQVFLKGGAEHVADVQVPGLADNGDDGRLCVEQCLEAGVLLGPDALSPRHAEGRDPGVPERQLADFLEILEVLGVRQRVAALHEIDAQLVEPARDLELVLEREVDALALAAVAEGGIVDLDACHGRSQNKNALKRVLQGAVRSSQRFAVGPRSYLPFPITATRTRRTPCAPVIAIGIEKWLHSATAVHLEETRRLW